MKAKISTKKKSNIVYISSYKKRNVVKPYAKFDLDWQEIIRANNSDKRLSEASVILSARVAYELHRNNDRPVYLTPDWFAKATKKRRHQNGRLRGQIKHIFHFKFHPKIRVDGVLLSNVYETCYTTESQKIMNLEDATISGNGSTKLHELELVSYSQNVQTVEHICSRGGAEMLQPIVDKEKEEALAYSSFSNNEKLKIKSFSEPDLALQETNAAIPTLANGFMNEPAKVYQIEEIRIEATEEIKNNHQLETKQISGLAEEKEHYQSHKCRDSSRGISLLLDVPLLTNLLAETILKSEEAISMEEQKIPLESERNMEFELSGAIFKNFGSARSDEIMENCKFVQLTPNKLGVQVDDKFSLSINDKELLRTCLRQVYGDNITIVSSEVIKIPKLEVQYSAPTQIVANSKKWKQFKKELLSFFPEKTAGHIQSSWFDKLRVSEDAPNNRIILTGSTFYVDSIYSRFERAIENVVKKQEVTLELHYENNEQRPIIYKLNGWSNEK